MSATNRCSIRHEFDFYETPAWCTKAIMPVIKRPKIVLDAGCGTGAIGGEYVPLAKVFGIESDMKRLDAARGRGLEVFFGNYLETKPNRPVDVDLIISNPPYSLAMEFVQKSLELIPEHGEVAM